MCFMGGEEVMFLWMAVTADKYELPLCIADSGNALGRMLGVSADTIRSNINKKCTKAHGKMKYLKIEVDDND